MNQPSKAHPDRDAGLLHLFTSWANGAVILAGTAASSRQSAFLGPRVPIPCGDCETTVFGNDDADAADRLYRHRTREHPVAVSGMNSEQHPDPTTP